MCNCENAAKRLQGFKTKFFGERKRNTRRKSYFSNVYGIMIFFIETALRYETVRLK